VKPFVRTRPEPLPSVKPIVASINRMIAEMDAERAAAITHKEFLK